MAGDSGGDSDVVGDAGGNVVRPLAWWKRAGDVVTSPRAGDVVTW